MYLPDQHLYGCERCTSGEECCAWRLFILLRLHLANYNTDSKSFRMVLVGFLLAICCYWWRRHLVSILEGFNSLRVRRVERLIFSLHSPLITFKQINHVSIFVRVCFTDTELSQISTLVRAIKLYLLSSYKRKRCLITPSRTCTANLTSVADTNRK